MKKILVTGATSYIGKHCIAELLKKKYDVRATVRDLNKVGQIKSDLKEYLNKDESWAPFNKSLIQMLSIIIPAFEKEGKSYLSIGLGCTGGQHRSVFVAEELYKHLIDKDYDVNILHTILQK